MRRRASELACALIVVMLMTVTTTVDSFSILPPPTPATRSSSSSTALYGGTGRAKEYFWTEEQYEIELRVTVPPNTKAKDVTFRADSRSVHLSLKDEVLLDGGRKFRGQIDTDGTFWTISDVEDNDGGDNDGERDRQIVVTMEKIVGTPDNEMEVVEFDWGGIYPDDGDEILSKDYAEAETLDIKEYAASLGVDIDNINMTMVDKTMFTSGINATMTKGMVEELTDRGYAEEVTRQDDGREFTVDPDRKATGEAVPLRPMVGDTSTDEQIDGVQGGGGAVPVPPIPFLDTPSPWQGGAPAVIDAETVEGDNDGKSAEGATAAKEDGRPLSAAERFKDPIDSLTVVKLKEILRKENLKVGGNKQELRDRLKTHVRSILLEKKDDR